MFWSGDLLSINGGRFSTVWLLGLQMNPSSLDKDERKKMKTSEILKIDVRKLLQEFAQFVPISEQHVSLRVSSYCVYGFARITKVKTKDLRLRIIRDQFVRRQKLKAVAVTKGGKPVVIDAPPTSANAVTLKDKKAHTFATGGGDLGSKEYLDFVDNFEKSLWNDEAWDAGPSDEAAVQQEFTVDPTVITMPDPELGIRNKTGRRNYDNDEDLGVPLNEDFGPADNGGGGFFDAPGLFDEPTDSVEASTTAAAPAADVQCDKPTEPTQEVMRTEDNEVATTVTTMPEPEMDFGSNFGQLRLDDDDDEDFRFPSNQEQADTGVLFDGQGLFDEQPPEPEVTTVQPAEVPVAAAPRKRTASEAASDAQTATTTTTDHVSKKRKKTDNLTPPPMADEDAAQFPEDEQLPENQDALLPEETENGGRSSKDVPTIEDELQPLEGTEVTSQNFSGPPGGRPNLDDEVVAETPPTSFDLESLDSSNRPSTRPKAKGKNKRRLAVDNHLQITEDVMRQQIGGDAYRANACLTSGFDDFDDMFRKTNFGRHLQVQGGRKLVMPTTRAGERAKDLLSFQEKVIKRQQINAPTDYYDFEDEEMAEVLQQQQHVDQHQDIQQDEQQLAEDAHQDVQQEEPQEQEPHEEMLQQDDQAPQDPQVSPPEVPEDVPLEDVVQESSKKGEVESTDSWEDMEEEDEPKSRLRVSKGSRDSTRRESAMRDTTGGGQSVNNSEVNLQVSGGDKRQRSSIIPGSPLPTTSAAAEREEASLAMDDQVALAADEEPEVNVSSMLQQPEMPPPVEEGRRASGGSSDEEQEKDADPFLVIAQVIQDLNDQPTRRMKFGDVYPSADRKNTARHAALAFRHLLTLQNQRKVDLTQDAANFKDPINIHLLM